MLQYCMRQTLFCAACAPDTLFTAYWAAACAPVVCALFLLIYAQYAAILFLYCLCTVCVLFVYCLCIVCALFVLIYAQYAALLHAPDTVFRLLGCRLCARHTICSILGCRATIYSLLKYVKGMEVSITMFYPNDALICFSGM